MYNRVVVFWSLKECKYKNPFETVLYDSFVTKYEDGLCFKGLEVSPCSFFFFSLSFLPPPRARFRELGVGHLMLGCERDGRSSGTENVSEVTKLGFNT